MPTKNDPVGMTDAPVMPVGAPLAAPLEQPDIWEMVCVDGVFIKQMHLKRAHTLVPQHSHEYPHSSLLAAGAVSVWCDGHRLGDYRAPHVIYIKEHCKHTFMSLEPNTVIYCIHNLHGNEQVPIAAMHQLGER